MAQPCQSVRTHNCREINELAASGVPNSRIATKYGVTEVGGFRRHKGSRARPKAIAKAADAHELER